LLITTCIEKQCTRPLKLILARAHPQLTVKIINWRFRAQIDSVITAFTPLIFCRGDGHRSLVTPERVLSEYNEDLIFFFLPF